MSKWLAEQGKCGSKYLINFFDVIKRLQQGCGQNVSTSLYERKKSRPSQDLFKTKKQNIGGFFPG